MKKIILFIALVALTTISAQADIYKGMVKQIQGCDQYDNCTEWVKSDPGIYITLDDDHSRFKMNGGGLNINAEILEVENEGLDEDGWPILSIQISDGGEIDFITVTINPNNLNEFIVSVYDDTEDINYSFWVK